MAYGDIGMSEAEKQRIAELETTCKEQSKYISKLGARIAGLKELSAWQERAKRAEASEADQGAWITTLEEKLRTLGRRNAAMLGRLDVMRRRTKTAEAENVKLQRKLNFLEGEDGCEHARRYWEDGTDEEGDHFDNCVACERDKLREALRKYGSHSENCAFLTMEECDCDFEAALAKGDEK